MIIVAYIIIAVAAIAGAYAICRAVDSHFTVKEIAVEQVYKAGVLSETIDHACEEIKWLTDEMMTSINDKLMEQFKNLG